MAPGPYGPYIGNLPQPPGPVSHDLREKLQHTVGDAYRLERELGGGGMSRVFVAHETSLGRKVVIKVLLPELAAGVSVERFRREIQLAAQLQHPHIVPLLAAGESDGLPYFTMPFVVGESLRTRVARGELPLNEAVHILRDVVSALAYAHTHGVVHRDIKPDNVLLSGGVAVVTDFGVAKAVSASGGDTHSNLTSMGVALGTPAYMAPEQATADPQVDHRADIYALGVMAYEMLTGQPPFAGRSAQAVLAAHVIEDPEAIERRRPSLPPALAALIMHCLAKRAADRPQAAEQILFVLDSLGTPSGGTTPTRAVPATPAPRRRAIVPFLAAAGIAVLAVAATLVVRSRRPNPAAPSATAPPAAVDSAAAPGVTPPRTDSSAGHSRVATSASPTVTPPAPAPAPAPTPARHLPAAADRPDSVSEPAHAAVHPRAETAASVSATGSTGGGRTGEIFPESVPAAVPVAPAPPPDPRPALRALVADYAAAIEAQNVAGVRRVYPEMSRAQEDGWAQFLGTVRDVKVTLSLSQVSVTGGDAEGQVSGMYTYVNTSTRRMQQQPVSFHVMFRRDGGTWRMAEVR